MHMVHMQMEILKSNLPASYKANLAAERYESQVYIILTDNNNNNNTDFYI